LNNKNQYPGQFFSRSAAGHDKSLGREDARITFSFLKDKIFYGWLIVAAGFLIGFIGMGTRYSYGVFLKSLEMDFGMSRAATSGIFSIYMLLCCLIAVAGGWAIGAAAGPAIGGYVFDVSGHYSSEPFRCTLCRSRRSGRRYKP